MTNQSYLDDLITFDSSNYSSKEEHQPNLFDIFLKRKRMNSERETYFPYDEMSLGELDSYYFRSD